MLPSPSQTMTDFLAVSGVKTFHSSPKAHTMKDKEHRILVCLHERCPFSFADHRPIVICCFLHRPVKLASDGSASTMASKEESGRKMRGPGENFGPWMTKHLPKVAKDKTKAPVKRESEKSEHSPPVVQEGNDDDDDALHGSSAAVGKDEDEPPAAVKGVEKKNKTPRKKPVAPADDSDEPDETAEVPKKTVKRKKTATKKPTAVTAGSDDEPAEKPKKKPKTKTAKPTATKPASESPAVNGPAPPKPAAPTAQVTAEDGERAKGYKALVEKLWQDIMDDTDRAKGTFEKIDSDVDDDDDGVFGDALAVLYKAKSHTEAVVNEAARRAAVEELARSDAAAREEEDARAKEEARAKEAAAQPGDLDGTEEVPTAQEATPAEDDVPTQEGTPAEDDVQSPDGTSAEADVPANVPDGVPVEEDDAHPAPEDVPERQQQTGQALASATEEKADEASANHATEPETTEEVGNLLKTFMDYAGTLPQPSSTDVGDPAISGEGTSNGAAVGESAEDNKDDESDEAPSVGQRSPTGDQVPAPEDGSATSDHLEDGMPSPTGDDSDLFGDDMGLDDHEEGYESPPATDGPDNLRDGAPTPDGQDDGPVSMLDDLNYMPSTGAQAHTGPIYDGEYRPSITAHSTPFAQATKRKSRSDEDRELEEGEIKEPPRKRSRSSSPQS